MATVFPESLQQFIIMGSMLGLGISLSLYSFIIPQIKKIFEKQAKKLRDSNKRLKEVSIKYGKYLLKGEGNSKLELELNFAKDEVYRNKSIKFHYGTGFLLTGILFGVSTIFPLLNMIGADEEWITLPALMSPMLLVFGVLILVYVWIMVFLDIKDLLKRILNEAVEESEKGLQKAEDDLKKSKEKTKKKKSK